MQPQDNSLFWADSFRQTMEGHAVDEGVLLWSLSGPSFLLRTPQAAIYIDPYLGGVSAQDMPNMYRVTSVPVDPSRIALADAVVMTHDHYDHCHPSTLTAMAESTAAPFYGPSSVIARARGLGLPDSRLHVVEAGDEFEVGDVTVSVWPGNDPGERHAVCYLFGCGPASAPVETTRRETPHRGVSTAVTVYFAGDSLPNETLDEVAAAGDVTIAMMAYGRGWYMEEGPFLDAVARLRPEVAIPYHWDIWYGYTGDPVALGRLIERRQPPFRVKLLLVGEYLHYRPDGTVVHGRDPGTRR